MNISDIPASVLVSGISKNIAKNNKTIMIKTDFIISGSIMVRIISKMMIIDTNAANNKPIPILSIKVNKRKMIKTIRPMNALTILSVDNSKGSVVMVPSCN